MISKNNYKLAGVVLGASILAGCSGLDSKMQDSSSAIRDFSLSQTPYAQNLIKDISCKSSKIEDYKGLTGVVKKYFDSMTDSGFSVCDITGGVGPGDYNKGLITVIDTVRANNFYKCKVSAFDDHNTIYSNNSTLDEKFVSASNLVSKNGDKAMSYLINEVRDCVIGHDIDKTFYTAKAADATSVLLWSTLFANVRAHNASANTTSTPTLGSGSATSTIGNATTGTVTTGSSSLPIGGSLLDGLSLPSSAVPNVVNSVLPTIGSGSSLSAGGNLFNGIVLKKGF